MMNKEKVIRTNNYYDTETGYLEDESDEFILHSFDAEPSVIWNDADIKIWYKDGLRHRDNNLPVWIWNNDYYAFYKNGKKYWFIDGGGIL